MSDWSAIFATLTARRDLSAQLTEAALEEILQGTCGEAETAAFLVGLRVKGETAEEIAAAARVVRRHMLAWDPGRPVLDTCGTGGDGRGTFNISTAVALVVAAAGVPVVKHGNRGVSSRSGSADVLACLGVDVEGDAAACRRRLDEAGLAFCFAPRFHPALKHVGPIRKRLGIPTLFNCLGPLANPAGACRQVVGVGRQDLLDVMAGALARLGTEESLVVWSEDGLDEISLAAPTQVRWIASGQVRSLTWTAADFGLQPVDLSEAVVDGPEESARLIETVLTGKDSIAARLVAANAGAALRLAGVVPDLAAGAARARSLLAEGKPRTVLERLRRMSAAG